MPDAAHRTALYCILARDAPRAVIFRRGPSKRVRLILWHTDTDRIEPGQWFHGTIYAKRSDLSPDGTLLVYFAGKHKPPPYTWTAISRPPYLTALTLWQKWDSWWGGGLFIGNDKLWLNHRPDELQSFPPQVPPPPSLHVHANPDATGEDYPIESTRWLRDGWKHIQEWQVRSRASSKAEPVPGYVTEQEDIWQRTSPRASLVLERWLKLTGLKEYRSFRVVTLAGTLVHELPGVSWADWDHTGRLVYAREGALLGLRFHEAVPEPEQLIAAFSSMTPEPMETPDWAQTW
jgi:hypothetical protein